MFQNLRKTKIILIFTVLVILFSLFLLIFSQKNKDNKKEISQRAQDIINRQAESLQEDVLITTDCFSAVSNLPLKNIRISNDTGGCLLNASYIQPIGQLTIKVEKQTPDFSIMNLPSLTIRKNNLSYFPKDILIPEGMETYSYASQEDLVTFIWQAPQLVVVSVYGFANLDETLISNVESIIASISLN